MRVIVLFLALASFGCAATRSGGGDGGALIKRVLGPQSGQMGQSSQTPADSAWLRFTAPRFGTRGCGPDTRDTLYSPMRCDVLRLRGQAPAWRPGCEASVPCWDSVRTQTTPDTVVRVWAMPGARCSVRVVAGEYVVEPSNSAGRTPCWVKVVKVQ